MTVHYFEGRNGQWYVRIVAGNGEVMFSSEAYVRKWNAKRAARRIARSLSLPVVDP